MEAAAAVSLAAVVELAVARRRRVEMTGAAQAKGGTGRRHGAGMVAVGQRGWQVWRVWCQWWRRY